MTYNNECNNFVEPNDYEKECKTLGRRVLDLQADKGKLVDRLHTAKQIITELVSLYYYPVTTEDDVKRAAEILDKAREFI